MATEAEYDDVIAPMLADLAQKCEGLGMSLVARVEWPPEDNDHNSVGITSIGVKNVGIGQKMAELAACCAGNIDKFCIEAMKRFDCSQSLVLRNYVN